MWTTETPKAGLYFWRKDDKGRTVIRNVEQRSDGSCAVSMDGFYHVAFSLIGGEWFAVPSPEEIEAMLAVIDSRDSIVAMLQAERDRLADELEATEASHADEEAAHQETLATAERLKAENARLAEIERKWLEATDHLAEDSGLRGMNPTSSDLEE